MVLQEQLCESVAVVSDDCCLELFDDFLDGCRLGCMDAGSSAVGSVCRPGQAESNEDEAKKRAHGKLRGTKDVTLGAGRTAVQSNAPSRAQAATSRLQPSRKVPAKRPCGDCFTCKNLHQSARLDGIGTIFIPSSFQPET